VSGWIKFWKDMPNDPRVLSAASELSKRYVLAHRTPGGGSDLSKTETCNAWRNAVTGALATLWCYADEHIRDDDSLPLTSQTLDAVVGLEGFFEVMPREWIDELDDGSIVLPGYCEKNSLIAKRKRTVKSNARVTRWRRANKASGNGVTRHHATHSNAAGDLDQDSDKKKSAAEPLVLHENLPREEWEEWLEHRRDKRLSMSPRALKKQLKLLAKYDTDTQRDIIDTSINAGWEGLFQPKGKPVKSVNGKNPYSGAI
jgi:hypothetical protein